MPNALKIRGKITEQGLTLDKVADLMGMSQPTLSQKIYGKRNMNLDEAERLAKLLGIEEKDYTVYFFGCKVQEAPEEGDEAE